MRAEDLVGKTLVAHKDGYMVHDGMRFCTTGKAYTIFQNEDTTDFCFSIRDDRGRQHDFDIEDYGNWFYIKEGAVMQKTPLYNPVKNISHSKYCRCTKTYRSVAATYHSIKSGCVWMYKSFCNKYYYWEDYNAKNEVIYFRGEVDWVKDNYEAYEAGRTTHGVLTSFSVEDTHKSLEQLTLENEDVEEKVVVMKEKSTGGKSDYYKIILPEWLVDKQQENGYIMLEDLAEVIFGNDFNFTNIFKAQKRMYEMTKGGGKEGNTFEYDATKCKYYVDKQLEISKRGV